MHVVSNPHDPRIQNPCAPLRIFMLRDIQTIGALVPPTSAVIYFPHMAPKKTSLKEIAEMLAHVVKHMATKDDLAAVETRLDHRIDKLDAKLDRLDTKLTKF
jgi:hypothetical protein